MAVSAQHDISPKLHTALSHIRSGDVTRARQLLWQTVAVAPGNPHAWLMLAHVARTTEEKRAALRHTIACSPQHAYAEQILRGLLSNTHVRQAAQTGIFICYAHQDELFSVELAEDLRAAGFHTWVDVLDIGSDTDWNEAINIALRRSGLMLLVVSPAALRATNTRAEYQWFMDAGKIIIPLQRHPCDIGGLNLWHPLVDFSQQYRAGLENLLHLILTPKAQPACTR